MDAIDSLKRAAALAAFVHIRSGQTVGLGTGSTARHVVDELGRRLNEGVLKDIVGVPTSERTRAQAEGFAIPLRPWTDDVPLDVAIDGADEIDPSLDLIKGLGGALLREKAVERRARTLIIVADGSKCVARLGERAPVPVEVTDHHAAVAAFASLGARARVDGVGEPVRSDNGHVIVDLHAGVLADPAGLAAELDAHPAVLDHGLFLRMASVAYVATVDGVDVLRR